MTNSASAEKNTIGGIQAASYVGFMIIEKSIEFDAAQSLREIMESVDQQMPTEKTVILQSDQLGGEVFSRICGRPRGKVLATRFVCKDGELHWVEW